MKLEQLLDIELLNQHRMNRLVGCQIHDTLPLRIYNYTSAAQFDPHWGDGTIDYCRGLIVDNEDNIIARPFKKFHNLNTESIPETMEANLPLIEPTVTKKMDGSLGIYYCYDGQEGIATRGSFTSDQAKWATAWYKFAKHQYLIGEWIPGTTTLFEIIYPENRIVVNYDFASLVLIGLVDNNTGFEYPYSMLRESAIRNGIRVVDRINDAKLEELKNANIENEEGYVLTYSEHIGPPLKVKVKMADYVRLHRIITGMNPRSVWELLKAGKDVKEQFKDCPVEFKKWLDKWVEKLYTEHYQIFSDAIKIYRYRPIQDTIDKRKYRAECAAYFKSQNRLELSGVFFGMLDRKDIDSIIWDMIEPHGDDMTFRKDGE